MAKMQPVVKWLLRDLFNAMLFFFGTLIILFIVLSANANPTHVSMSGLEANQFGFCFIYPMAIFATSFRFTQAFNRSRKTLFHSMALAFGIMAVATTLFGWFYGSIIGRFLSYDSLMIQIFPTSSLLSQFVIFFVGNVFAFSLGWLIVTVLYRASAMGKLFIFLSSVVAIYGYAILNRLMGYRLTNGLQRILEIAFGHGNPQKPNPWIASLSLLVLSGLFLAGTFQALKRTNIRTS